MIKGLTIGRFDVLLTFEQSTVTRNAIDEDQASWSTYRQMYGRRRLNTAQESVEASQIVGDNEVAFDVRYDSTLTSLMRFRQGSDTTYFYLTGVEHWQREGYTIVRGKRRDNV